MDNSELTEQARLGWPADRVAKVLAIALGLPWPVVGWQCKECQFKSQCVVNREVVSGSERKRGTEYDPLARTVHAGRGSVGQFE